MEKSGELRTEFYQRWAKGAKPYFKWQFDQFSGYLGNKVADVGCGLGNFAPFLQEKELYLGFEIDEELREIFRTTIKNDRMKLGFTKDICDKNIAQELRANQIDSVICVNVLEHIKDDRIVLSNLVDGIPVGGHLCLLVPALPFIYGSFDKLDGHYRRYLKADFAGLGKGLPVKVLDIYYMNFIGAFGWYLKGKLLKQERQADSDYQAMNLILPVVSRLESILRPPIGMSLVMILEKTT